ncbi:MAG: SRPBCC domain-containing protein [Planctomycetales bacterium]|nr:SRPBCC domain-containing protein [Planctomycetales bacterium]
MRLELKSDFPVTDAACRKETGKTMKAWFDEIGALVAGGQSRRDAIRWLYDASEKNAWWSTTLWVEYERKNGIVDKKDGHIEGYNICVTKTVAASVADVYAVFADAKAWKQWFGDDAQADVKEQGTFQDSAGHQGEFLRVRKDKDLRFTFSHPGTDYVTRVDVAVADKGKGKTGITLTHNRLQTREEADGLRAAWSEVLDRLKQIAES